MSHFNNSSHQKQSDHFERFESEGKSDKEEIEEAAEIEKGEKVSSNNDKVGVRTRNRTGAGMGGMRRQVISSRNGELKPGTLSPDKSDQ
jgi:hypothetical protein